MSFYSTAAVNASGVTSDTPGLAGFYIYHRQQEVARIRTILGETAAAAGDVADTGDRAYISRNDDRP